MARTVGSRVSEYFGNAHGTITEVHPVPGYPELTEYSIVWDDQQFSEEIWSEQDLKPEAE